MTSEQSQDGAVDVATAEVQPEVDVKALQKELADAKASIGSLKRDLKDALKTKEPVAEPQTNLTKEPSELDYGQKAFLKASGINGSDEIALVREFAKRTGDSLDSIVEDDIFKARLERLRTTKSNEVAAQSAGRGNQSQDIVARELAKLGPNDSIPENLPRDVREKLVDLRRNKGSNAKQFYND